MADVLNKIVNLMSKEEQRNFKLFALRSHEDDARKDLNLFDYIRKAGDEYEDQRAMRQLYGKDARPNTYHRLRNRLLQEVGKSIALLHWDKDETVAALHELTLAMLYRKKREHEIAAYYLRRAEKRISQLDLPELLDIVLGEFIALSFELNSINPERFIARRTENRRRLSQLWEIDNVLAMVNHRLRRAQNLGIGNQDVVLILQKTVAEYAQDQQLMADPKFRFRMYDAVTKILLEQRDYVALETYLLQTYDAFVAEELFHKGNHELKLQMLTYIINALYKNGKTDSSLAYADLLREAMEQQGQIYKAKYEFFYYNSLVLNYSSRSYADAIKVLEQMLANESLAAVPQYFIFIYLNLSLMEYALRNFKAAIKYVVRLRMHAYMQAADAGLRLRVDIFELALRLELHDDETLVYRYQQIRHDFQALLAEESMAKDAQMLHLIARMNEVQNLHKDEHLVADIRAFQAQYPTDDTEIFKYGEFLGSKI